MRIDKPETGTGLDATGMNLAVVVSRFNSQVTEKLLEGALDGLARSGCPRETVDVFEVPGSREIPLVALELGRGGRYSAIICLGAVIRGETSHYDYVCQEASRGIAESALQTGVPVIFGVLTCDTLAQALDRAGGQAGNKGCDAALAAVEMAHLMRRLRQHK